MDFRWEYVRRVVIFIGHHARFPGNDIAIGILSSDHIVDSLLHDRHWILVRDTALPERREVSLQEMYHPTRNDDKDKGCRAEHQKELLRLRPDPVRHFERRRNE